VLFLLPCANQPRIFQELNKQYLADFLPPSLSGFIIERPSSDRHIPPFEEVFEVFFIDAVVPAGQAESLEPIALYPFQDRTLAYLAVVRDIL
jgi:hypothetical protein